MTCTYALTHAHVHTLFLKTFLNKPTLLIRIWLSFFKSYIFSLSFHEKQNKNVGTCWKCNRKQLLLLHGPALKMKALRTIPTAGTLHVMGSLPQANKVSKLLAKHGAIMSLGNRPFIRLTALCILPGRKANSDDQWGINILVEEECR